MTNIKKLKINRFVIVVIILLVYLYLCVNRIIEMHRIKLILIGGAEDKTSKLEILSEVAKAANYKNIVLIPSASSYPHEVEQNYIDAFRKLNIENFVSLDIRYPDECDRRENFEAIEKANLLFFSGGDQVKLVDTIGPSNLFKFIKQRFSENSLIIAGTSAGAASASENMLFDGDYHGFIKGKVNFSKGFGFIEKVIIDTHFLNRERIPRLVQALAHGIEDKAIGIDEDTAIFIDTSDTFSVVGNGMVTLLNSDDVTYNDFFEIKNEEIYNINNIKIGFLSRGARFDLKTWSVISPQFSVIEPDKYIHDPSIIDSRLFY